MNLPEYVQARLSKIQFKHNFNPVKGADQVYTNPKLWNAFGRFQELLELNKSLDLNLKIPFDPMGLNPETLNELPAIQEFVYFFQYGTSSIWKIGFSKNPIDRLSAGQVWGESELWPRHQIPGGRDLEKQIHRYLRKFKTRNKNKSGGEVFNLSTSLVKNLVQKLKTSDTTFLKEKFNENFKED